MLRGIAGVALLLAVASPASARTVELMDFTGQRSPEALVDPQLELQGPGAGAVPAAALAHDFEAMATAPAIGAAPMPTDGISIPLWLQTGVSPRAGAMPTSQLLPLVMAPGVPNGCGDTSFRPRPDLAASTQTRRARLFPLVAQVACEAGIPVGLFDALVVQESRYQIGALSPKGAAGLTQLMPGTARELGVRNSWDALENLRGGALYLRRQLNDFGRVDLALAAYNAGPGRVRRRLRVPAIPETVNYVHSITRAWNGGSRGATIIPAGVRSSEAASRVRLRTVDLASF